MVYSFHKLTIEIQGFTMTEGALFEQWEASFRAAAEKDQYAMMQEHLDRFERTEESDVLVVMSDDPVALVEGTIQVVRAVCSHYMVDGRPIEPFLSKQAYDPQDVPDMTYSFTFILGGDVPARILLATKRATIDLVDLLNQPWENRTVGYKGFVASRNDGGDLSPEEVAKIEKEVLSDYYYDYGEDEIDVFFDECSYPGCFHIHAYEND
jgi:hypothetical protein